MEGQAVKVYTVGLVVLSCFPSSREFSSPAIFTRGLAWGSLNPLHDTHTHTHTESIYMHFSPSPSLYFCLSLGFLSVCLCLLLSLSFFLPLFSVRLVNPSSLYRTTSFDTHSKSLSVSSCTDRMRPSFPKKLCGCTWVYARLSSVNTALPCILLHACDVTHAYSLSDHFYTFLFGERV